MASKAALEARLLHDLVMKAHRLYRRRHGDGGTEMEFGEAVAEVAYHAGLKAGEVRAADRAKRAREGR